jgi:hypothetical protein
VRIRQHWQLAVKSSIAILFGLVLSGCAVQTNAPGPYAAWDGRTPLHISEPRQPGAHKHVTTGSTGAIRGPDLARLEEDLMRYERFSPQWRVAKEAADQAWDQRLAQAMSICRGC